MGTIIPICIIHWTTSTQIPLQASSWPKRNQVSEWYSRVTFFTFCFDMGLTTIYYSNLYQSCKTFWLQCHWIFMSFLPKCDFKSAAEPAKNKKPTSLYKSKESLSVCLSVCVCSNISADQDQTDLRFSTWLLRGLRVCNIGFKLFHSCFTNSTSIVNHSHHSHVRTRANHCRVHPHDTP